MNSFVLRSAVQTYVIYFPGLVALQIARNGSWKTILKLCLVQLNIHLITHRTPPSHLYCTFSRCSLLDKCHYYFTETHHTSVTVNELLLYESYCELKNSIKYIESDRCHMSHLPITTTNETMNPLQCDSGWSFNCCNYFGNIGQWYRESSFWDTTSVLYIFLKGSFYIIFGLIWARSNTVKWWLALLAKIHHLAGTFLCGIWVFSHVSACILLRYSGFLLQSVTYS